MKTRRKLIFVTFVMGLIFFAKAATPQSVKSQKTLISEAQLMMKAENQYLDVRLKNKWEKIYSFQHPNYKKAISLEEFKYFKGRVAMDYRKDKSFHHISGSPTYPSVEEIKKNEDRKDLMGFPLLFIYRFIPNNPRVQIKGYKLEKISIDNKGMLGKVIVKLKGVERMPFLFRMPETKIKRDILYIDYWEKVGSKWYITLLKTFFRVNYHISGTQTEVPVHPVPVDLSPWETSNFIDFDVTTLQ